MKKAALILLTLVLIAQAKSINHLQLTKAERESEFPRLAWNGSQLGAAWMEGRDGNLEIYFRMADMNTSSLGSEHRITSSETWDDHPRLCWTGSEFGLSWIHERKTKFDLMFRKLDDRGNPLGKSRAIVSQILMGKETVICWTGGGYGIVSTEFRGSMEQGELVFRYLDENGSPVGPPQTVVGGMGRRVPAQLLRAGSNFMLFFLDSSLDAVFMVKLDPFGKPRGMPIQLNQPGTRADLPAADSNDTVIIAAWPQANETGKDVMVLPMSAGGEPLGTPYPVTPPGADRPSTAVAAGTGGFGLAWLEITDQGRALFFRVLDESGKPLEQPIRLSKPRPVKIMTNRVEMIVDNAGYVIAWVDVAPPMNTEVVLSRVGF